MTVRHLLPLLAAAPLAACGGDDPAFAPPTPPSAVVLVVVDTLRADHLGVYGFDELGEAGIAITPRLDALAAEGVRLERCYAAAPWTVPSVATILTGLWPWEHGALRLLEPLDQSLVTLPEAFRAAGWRTAGVTTNFVATGRYGFAQGFEAWDDGLATGHEGSSAFDAANRLVASAEALAEDPGEGLFLHLLLFEPHFRYEEHPYLRFGFEHAGGEPYAGHLDGTEELTELRAELASGKLSERDLEFLRARYASEVAQTDRMLRLLAERLDALGLWDDALVVVTSDHGERLGDRDWIGHTVGLTDELVRVPTLVKLPAAWSAGRAGAVVERPLSQVDLAATLLELAGVGPGALDERAGRETWTGDLLGSETGGRRHLFLHTDFEPELEGGAAKRALQFGVVDSETLAKWVVDHRPATGEPPVGSLYDLDADPGETRDLAGGGVPDAARDLLLLRGLVPEPLAGRDGGEPAPPGVGPDR